MIRGFWAWTRSSGNTGVSGSVRSAARSPVFTGNSHPIVSTGAISLVWPGARNAGTQPIAILSRPQGISTQSRQPRTGSSTYVTLPTLNGLFSVERQERQGWGRAPARNHYTKITGRPENWTGPGTRNKQSAPTTPNEQHRTRQGPGPRRRNPTSRPRPTSVVLRHSLNSRPRGRAAGCRSWGRISGRTEERH